MKRILYLALVAAATIALTQCKCKTKISKASEAAMEYDKKIQDGDYDGFVEMISFENAIPAVAPTELAQVKAQYSATMKQVVKPHVDSKGGVKTVAVVSETPAPAAPADENQAVVVLAKEYNNGETEEITYDMGYSDGAWKIKTNEYKDAWKVTLADGSHESFKIIDRNHESTHIEKSNEDGERDFNKIKEKENVIVEKIKEDGDREVIRTKKD